MADERQDDIQQRVELVRVRDAGLAPLAPGRSRATWVTRQSVAGVGAFCLVVASLLAAMVMLGGSGASPSPAPSAVVLASVPSAGSSATPSPTGTEATSPTPVTTASGAPQSPHPTATLRPSATPRRTAKPTAIPGSLSGSFATINAPLATFPRQEYTVTRLADGRILIAGGSGNNVSYQHWDDRGMSEAQLFDPASGTYTSTGPMAQARQCHTATLLGDGRVLVAGGWLYDPKTPKTIDAAEIYDPGSGTFTATGRMTIPRCRAAAVALDDGRVLIVGGQTSGPALPNNAELYDPAAGTFDDAGRFPVAYANRPVAVKLADGTVLVVGDTRSPSGPDLNLVAQIFDPVSGSWRTSGSLGGTKNQGYTDATATLLPDGRAFITSSDGAFVFDPARGQLSALPAPKVAATSALVLRDGRVVTVGSCSPMTTQNFCARIFDPPTGTFKALATPPGPAIAAFQQDDGSILFIGRPLGGMQAFRFNP